MWPMLWLNNLQFFSSIILFFCLRKKQLLFIHFKRHFFLSVILLADARKTWSFNDIKITHVFSCQLRDNNVEDAVNKFSCRYNNVCPCLLLSEWFNESASLAALENKRFCPIRILDGRKWDQRFYIRYRTELKYYIKQTF